MQVVDIRAFSVMFTARSIRSQIPGPEYTGVFEPIEGNFIMQVVDIRAFSVMFTACSIPDSWSRIYGGIFSPLREIL